MSRLALLLALVLTACAPIGPPPPTATGDTSTSTSSASPSNSPLSSTYPTASPSSGTCQPTDQDQFVYHPTRLTLMAPCIRVSGTIAAIRKEADGDRHILVALDPQYAALLTPANQGIELGDLVVEPVCVGSVTQADAIGVCGSDHNPLDISGLSIGAHLWLEGRYVLDTSHGGWAELHPCYRYGPA